MVTQTMTPLLTGRVHQTSAAITLPEVEVPNLSEVLTEPRRNEGTEGEASGEDEAEPVVTEPRRDEGTEGQASGEDEVAEPVDLPILDMPEDSTEGEVQQANKRDAASQGNVADTEDKGEMAIDTFKVSKSF